MNVSSMYSSHPAITAKDSTSPTSSSNSSSSSSSSSSGLDPTFMSLLMSELQYQDPTSPMDTTDMVGQMISLNSLDELMSIQSILQNSLGSATTPTSDGTTNG